MSEAAPNTNSICPIPFCDLKRQYLSVKCELDSAIASTLARGNFILGEEVERFETEFAQYIGARYAVGVGSGTEALYLSLCALGIGFGDEVITVPNTAMPTVSAISMTGAKPVFVDIDSQTYNMDTSQVESAISSRTKAIIPVHLYGNAVDMDSLVRITQKHNVAVVEDACQAHGAEYKDVKVGAIGNIGAFSFYPTKNLGCFGDGGAIVTNDEALARHIRLLRFYGMTDKDKYIHVIKGINSRLDEVQAAILRVKLKHLDRWNEIRRANASLYYELLARDPVQLPKESSHAKHVYHLYVVRMAHRDELRSYLKRQNISTLIHYRTPIHLQPAYSDLNLKEGSFPITERCAKEILSLPMFPELTKEEIQHIIQIIQCFFSDKGKGFLK